MSRTDKTDPIDTQRASGYLVRYRRERCDAVAMQAATRSRKSVERSTLRAILSGRLDADAATFPRIRWDAYGLPSW